MALNRKKKRLNVWIDEDLYNDIEKYSNKVRVTKSYAVSVLCIYGLEYLDEIKKAN